MWLHPIEEALFESFKKYTKTGGVVFVLLGVIGIIFPVFMSYFTISFVGWLMVFSGIIAGYFTYISHKGEVLGWLKSFLFVGLGLMVLYYPMQGIAGLGIVLSIYFFMDSFTNLSIALSSKSNKAWILWLLNAIFSFLVALLFIINWPLSSLYLVGLLVGFSLFFDGIALLGGGYFLTRMK